MNTGEHGHDRGPAKKLGGCTPQFRLQNVVLQLMRQVLTSPTVHRWSPSMGGGEKGMARRKLNG